MVRICVDGSSSRGGARFGLLGPLSCLPMVRHHICSVASPRRQNGHMGTLLLIILVLLLVGALPTWPYSSGWGYYPSGGLGLVLLVVLLLLLTGRL
jgi:hypothetical protein